MGFILESEIEVAILLDYINSETKHQTCIGAGLAALESSALAGVEEGGQVEMQAQEVETQGEEEEVIVPSIGEPLSSMP